MKNKDYGLIKSNTLCPICKRGLLKFDGIKIKEFDNQHNQLSRKYKCLNCNRHFYIDSSIFISNK